MDKIGDQGLGGITVGAEEGGRLRKNLGHHRILMLRNHGPVVLGKTLPAMFFTMWALQRACEIQCATLAMGKPVLVGDDVIAVHQRDLSQVQLPGGPGAADFAAWVRRIDKLDRSWRD